MIRFLEIFASIVFILLLPLLTRFLDSILIARAVIKEERRQYEERRRRAHQC